MTKHEPKPGRLAYVCPHKDHVEGVAYRVFADPDRRPPECPSHGKTMVLQGNKPYLDQKIPAA